MRILLVGEYSNLHNSLKEGLLNHGHQVILLGTGDAFKKLPVDINVRGQYMQDNFLLNGLRQVFFKATRQDLAYLETYVRTTHKLKGLGQFDVIQLINEYPFKTPYFLERKLIEKLRKMTRKLVILGCGDDFIYLKERHRLPHHPIDVLSGKQEFPWSAIYLTKRHEAFHKWVFEQKDLLITTDLDYHTIYKEEPMSDYFGMIPNPVNLDRFPAKEYPGIEDKIVIFHGINRSNFYKKGNDLFEKALQKINEKYADKIQINTVESLPYAEYIKQYDAAHIVLDQTYALDQGYNALEAMAKGKVVFTGAGEAFCSYYSVEKNTVAINCNPDINQIVQNLEYLIKNPEKLVEIGTKARDFVLKIHDYRQIAQFYINAWEGIS